MKRDIPFLIPIKSIGDQRGFFRELWHDADFAEITGISTWKQSNWSRSQKGVLRGLHFQKGNSAQAKAVWIVTGSVFDVCLDLRPQSFGKKYEFTLSDEDPHILFVPAHFAHGFCTLSENTNFLYLCSEVYDPKSEAGILWNDPALGIKWPLQDVTLSERDKVWPKLADLKI